MKKSVVMKWYKAERFFFKYNMISIAKIIYHLIQIIFGCTIPYTALLEDGVDIAHFHGIVIHHKSIIKKIQLYIKM